MYLGDYVDRSRVLCWSDSRDDTHTHTQYLALGTRMLNDDDNYYLIVRHDCFNRVQQYDVLGATHAQWHTSILHTWWWLLNSMACHAYSSHTVKHYFFCRILISRFPCVENSLHFNFVDFPLNFIKQFVSYFAWSLKQMLLLKFVPYYCLN